MRPLLSVLKFPIPLSAEPVQLFFRSPFINRPSHALDPLVRTAARSILMLLQMRSGRAMLSFGRFIPCE